MKIRNERGSVLMLVVIFSLVMCLVGFAVLYMNGMEYLSTRRDLLDSRAALLADAGLAMGVEFLYFCDARIED
jgi:Tfp pilus assembly protein PilX